MKYENTIVKSSSSDLIISTGLYSVNSLVAVIPGVQLFVFGVVVDAAVAGVALWEKHHGAFITAKWR